MRFQETAGKLSHLEAHFLGVGFVDPHVVDLEGRIAKCERAEVDLLDEPRRLVRIQQRLHRLLRGASGTAFESAVDSDNSAWLACRMIQRWRAQQLSIMYADHGAPSLQRRWPGRKMATSAAGRCSATADGHTARSGQIICQAASSYRGLVDALAHGAVLCYIHVRCSQASSTRLTSTRSRSS